MSTSLLAGFLETFEKVLDLIKRDLLVIQIRVIGSRNNHQLLIVPFQFLESVFTKVAGVSLFAVNHQNSASDFVRETQ